jgi:hypothetical protein
MAGLDPAIQALCLGALLDARVKPAHDGTNHAFFIHTLLSWNAAPP